MVQDWVFRMFSAFLTGVQLPHERGHGIGDRIGGKQQVSAEGSVARCRGGSPITGACGHNSSTTTPPRTHACFPAANHVCTLACTHSDCDAQTPSMIRSANVRDKGATP